ncbi:MAG: hypothetical protein GXO43_06955 [Crenarchaeota archaeon]|nr:hypothetical protein [Thermoproteota archaeon]
MRGKVDLQFIGIMALCILALVLIAIGSGYMYLAETNAMETLQVQPYIMHRDNKIALLITITDKQGDIRLDVKVYQQPLLKNTVAPIYTLSYTVDPNTTILVPLIYTPSKIKVEISTLDNKATYTIIAYSDNATILSYNKDMTGAMMNLALVLIVIIVALAMIIALAVSRIREKY